MKKDFEILKVTRKNILKAIQGLSPEQLVKIPSGFKNNILWNMGHIVSSGQKLTYGLSGIPMKIAEEYPALYGKGSDPGQWKTIPDIQMVKEDLAATPAWLEEDYNKGVFTSYKEYETSYGLTIKNIEEAIAFCNTHEAVHLGVIMALKKIV